MSHGISTPDSQGAGNVLLFHLDRCLTIWREANGFLPLVLRDAGTEIEKEAIAVPFILSTRLRRDDPFVVATDGSHQEVPGLRPAWDEAWEIASRAKWVSGGDLLQVRLPNLTPTVADLPKGTSATLPFLLAMYFHQHGMSLGAFDWAASGCFDESAQMPAIGLERGAEWAAKLALIEEMGIPEDQCLFPDGSWKHPTVPPKSRISKFAGRFPKGYPDEKIVAIDLGHIEEAMEDVQPDYQVLAAKLDRLLRVIGEATGHIWDELRGTAVKLRADVVETNRRRVEGERETEKLEASINNWHGYLRKEWAVPLVNFIPLDAWEYQKSRPIEEPTPGKSSAHEVCDPLPDFLRETYPDFSKPDSHVPLDRRRAGALDLLSSPPRTGGLFALLEQEPRAVVLGEPGGGKTTCLKRMALDGAGNYQPGGLVTLFVPLVKWAEAGGFWSLIDRSTGFSPSQVERLISSKRCRILLDAINECPDALRAAAVREISGFLRDHPGLPIVISARSPETTRPFDLPSFFVDNISEEKRRALLHAWLGDEAKADALLANLVAQPWGEFLASTPMRLRMLAQVAETGDELPTGVAALYRRWIDRWYVREEAKEEAVGSVLTWSLAEVRKALATLASTARRAGKRLMSDNLALGALVNTVRDPHGFLQWLSNGLFLRRAEGHLEFPHETFQEYFCAEALLAEPGVLKDCGTQDYGTWGMPIAYAAELKDPLPEDLMAAVWRISPWMGAALITDAEEIPELPTRLEPLIRWSVTGVRANVPSGVFDYDPLWYRREPTLSHIVHSSSSRKERWKRFEVSRLKELWKEGDLWKEGGLWEIIRESLTLRERWSKQQLKENRIPYQKWVRECKPSDAAGLIDAGVLEPEDFSTRKAEWIATATPGDVAWLIDAGVLEPEDFSTRKAEWIATATPGDAAWLIGTRVLSPKDLATRKAEWIATATPFEVVTLVKAGILEVENFAARKAEWIATATPFMAAHLIDARLLEPNSFSSRKADWIATGEPHELKTLIKSKVLGHKCLATRKAKWITTATPCYAAWLIDTGLLSPKDLATRKAEWIATACPMSAGDLYKCGLFSIKEFASWKAWWIAWAKPYDVVDYEIEVGYLTLEDYAPRKAEWIATATPGEAIHLIQAGVLAPEDFAERIVELIATATPHDAACLISAGVLTADELAAHEAEWIATAGAGEAVTLIKTGLLKIEDFDARRTEWIATATPLEVVKLVKAGILSVEDFAVRRAEWIGTAAPEDAACLIDAGLFATKDFSSHEAEWITTANPSEAVTLIKAGLLSAKDFSTRGAEWIATATLDEAFELLRAGVLARVDFSSRKDELIANAGPDEAVGWSESGFAGITPSDFEYRKDDLFRMAMRFTREKLWALELRPSRRAGEVDQ